MPWIESGGCLICVKMDAEIGETLRELGVFGGRRCAYDTENGFVLRSQKKNHIFCVCVCVGGPTNTFIFVGFLRANGTLSFLINDIYRRGR